MMRWLRVGLPAAAAACLASGCATRTDDAYAGDAGPDRGTCESEARRLLAPVDVFARPAPSAPVATRLPDGAFIYLCETRHGWTGIMYPMPGAKVDCTHRSPTDQCRTGWVRDTLRSLEYGQEDNERPAHPAS